MVTKKKIYDFLVFLILCLYFFPYFGAHAKTGPDMDILTIYFGESNILEDYASILVQAYIGVV